MSVERVGDPSADRVYIELSEEPPDQWSSAFAEYWTEPQGKMGQVSLGTYVIEHREGKFETVEAGRLYFRNTSVEEITDHFLGFIDDAIGYANTALE